MKTKTSRRYWVLGMTVIAAAMAFGFRAVTHRHAHVESGDATYLYEAAAYFNNQHYVPW